MVLRKRAIGNHTFLEPGIVNPVTISSLIGILPLPVPTEWAIITSVGPTNYYKYQILLYNFFIYGLADRKLPLKLVTSHLLRLNNIKFSLSHNATFSSPGYF